MDLLQDLFNNYATASKLPVSARKPYPGGWVITDRVRLNSYRYHDHKLLKIMKDPHNVLNNVVKQDPVIGVWDAENQLFVLRNGNHRLRVAVGLQKPLFYIHTVWTCGDMSWQPLLQQVTN